MKQTWTQPVCDDCWYFAQSLKREEPQYDPVRLVDPDTEQCCNCGGPAISGIYVRMNPAQVRYPRQEMDDE